MHLKGCADKDDEERKRKRRSWRRQRTGRRRRKKKKEEQKRMKSRNGNGNGKGELGDSPASTRLFKTLTTTDPALIFFTLHLFPASVLVQDTHQQVTFIAGIFQVHRRVLIDSQGDIVPGHACHHFQDWWWQGRRVQARLLLEIRKRVLDNHGERLYGRGGQVSRR